MLVNDTEYDFFSDQTLRYKHCLNTYLECHVWPETRTNDGHLVTEYKAKKGEQISFPFGNWKVFM